jgi:two-component system, cell cycle sensor histidine kinase and response regulator CckA
VQATEGRVRKPIETSAAPWSAIEILLGPGMIMNYDHEILASLRTRLCEEGDGSPPPSVEDLDAYLRQFQKMETLGRMAAGVAHDFNRLLTIIMGYNELVLHGTPVGHPLRDYLMEINRAATQAARLTRQVLHFSHKDAAKAVPLEIAPLVEDTQRMLRSFLSGDIDLVCVHTPGSGRVQASPGQVEQVLMNLVLNARDAMPDGGRITLVTENVFLKDKLLHAHGVVPPGSYVRLAVSDTGCGMEEATLARIFLPFFTTKGPGRGTGLGLAIIQGIVRQNAGHIVVASQLGRGSTFAVYLPRLTARLSAPHTEMSVA